MRAPYLLIIGLLCLVLIYFMGYAISTASLKLILVLMLGFIISSLTIIKLEIGLFLLIFAVPFTQQLTLAKFSNIPFDIGTDDIIIIFIIISWLANLAKRKEPIILRTSLNWPLFAFFTAAIFSFIGSNLRFREDSILLGIAHLFKFYEYVIIYFVVVSTVRNLEQIKKLLRMFFVVVSFITFVHFISMFIWGQFSLTAPPATSYLFMRTMYAFQSNTYLGAYYAFFLSILIAIILERARGENRIPLILFAFIISLALFNTFSRSSYLGILLSFIIIASLKEKRFFLIALLLIVFSPIFLQEAVFGRIALTIQSIRPTLTLDQSSAIRLLIWKKGLNVFLQNFVFGTGYWTTRWAVRAEAHSQYLAVLVETGIVGFSIFCWLVVRMFKNSIALMKEAGTGFFHALGLGYTAGLTAVLTICFFSEALQSFRITGALWFVTGLVTSARRLLAENSEAKVE